MRLSQIQDFIAVAEGGSTCNLKPVRHASKRFAGR